MNIYTKYRDQMSIIGKTYTFFFRPIAPLFLNVFALAGRVTISCVCVCVLGGGWGCLGEHSANLIFSVNV